MKISVNDIELYTLTEEQKKIIKNEIQEEIFEQDMKRRLEWVLIHKYEECMKNMINEWDSILKQRYSSLPTNSKEIVKLIMSQPDYKNRTQRESDSVSISKDI